MLLVMENETMGIYYYVTKYLLVRAFKTPNFDSKSTQGPTYNNLSNLPGLNNAGSIKSGLLVAP